jgi:hypothetical protein
MEPMEPMEPMKPMKPMKPMEAAPQWWPDKLGTPAASGGQDSLRYAWFPETKRLAVQRDGSITLHDSGDHEIAGVSQGGGDPVFTSQHGSVKLGDLPVVS